MRYVRPERWAWALGSYAAAGVLIGIAAGPMQTWAQAHLGRGGYGVFFAVNVLLPLATLIVSVWYPRVLIAVVGGVLVAGFFALTRVTAFNWRAWEWTPGFVAGRTSPIEVAAGVGCAAVGVITATVVNMFRRVGYSPRLCGKCGYEMEGLEGAVCPECGAGVAKRS